MSHIHEFPITLNSSHVQQRDVVSPDQYELPKVSASQRLTPLDMNMPRLYGMRWILCFPLPPNADKLKM
jgi:trichothecene 3-O-acetyltransferase